MKNKCSMYIFSLQGFATLFTDNNPPDNFFYATHLALLPCTLDGTNWNATVVTMLVSKQQCCFCIVLLILQKH